MRVKRVIYDVETCLILSHAALERWTRDALKTAGFRLRQPYHLLRHHKKKCWIYWQEQGTDTTDGGRKSTG